MLLNGFTFTLFLISCDGFTESETLLIDSILMTGDSTVTEAPQLILTLPEEEISSLIDEMVSGEQLRQTLEYRVVVRSGGVLAGRVSERFSQQIAFDPYQGLFVLRNSWEEVNSVFPNDDELQRAMSSPLLFPLPPFDRFTAGQLEINTSMYHRLLPVDSVFNRWLVFSRYRLIAESYISYDWGGN